MRDKIYIIVLCILVMFGYFTSIEYKKLKKTNEILKEQNKNISKKLKDCNYFYNINNKKLDSIVKSNKYISDRVIYYLHQEKRYKNK
tara:strand:+ start:113 stop:373 length:261 start_codon:yes stop_codon:yes gene_type:complete